uniref:Uncharacterized protein n=1 Tax=Arundo donax TaxID=35708 RepID=A0A0A9BAF8_ARUDO
MPNSTLICIARIDMTSLLYKAIELTGIAVQCAPS